ncbi:hypothetical protein CYMTET_13245 [Cymbomonas tetramitiformis]|uniref:t-SNARE coiled-coil homology domain-containing protein n=1 Tax=Cymbomonas tetramitiformis TaxID=36881 RepID=A0AAE0GIW8_9CHLO|nr:hypothetical protein CYMTET_13245 [Cymbomonas tetramitiformis]|eukprot:gene25550-31228_t
MSFQDAWKSVGTPINPDATSADSSYSALSKSVSELTNAVRNFESNVNEIGGKNDNSQLRSRLHTVRETIQTMSKDISVRLKVALSENPAQGDDVKVTQAQLIRDFQAALKDFQQAQKTSLTKQRSARADSAAKVTARAEAGSRAEKVSLIASKPQVGGVELSVTESEGLYTKQLIDDREDSIIDMQEQIGEVHAIFKDLAFLLDDQGSTLEDIEANITRTGIQAKKGLSQLDESDKRRRLNRNRMCYVAFAFLIVLIVLMIVLLGNKSS